MTVEQIATYSLELAEAKMIEDHVRSMPAAVKARIGARIERIGSAVAIVTSELDVPLLNRVVGLGCAEPLADDAVETLVRAYGGSANRHMVQVVPRIETIEIRSKLEARGLRRLDNWLKLKRGAEPAGDAGTDLQIVEVGQESAHVVAKITCEAFGLPMEHAALLGCLAGRAHWRSYLGLDGNQPVAAGLMFVDDGVAWLGYDATLSSHRRRGAQGALIARRIRDGLAAGCHNFHCEVEEETRDHPNPSQHNMLRNGFRIAYPRRNYVYFPGAAQ